MRILNIIIFSILWSIGVRAQEIKVLSFQQKPMDLSASTHPQYDINNDAGALVKVLFAEPNVKFEGDIIGTPEYKNTEYWVYLTSGSKFLVVKASNAIPLQVSFVDNKLSSAQSKMTYELVLSRSGRAQKQTLAISFSPSSAIVLIDGKKYPSNNGKVVAKLPVGKHDFIVAADGYESYEGSVTLRESSPSNIQTTLQKSVNVDMTHSNEQNYNDTNANVSAFKTEQPQNTNSANSNYILDKVAEGKRLYDKKDYTAAYKCFQVAAEAGNAEAQNLMGFCYENGQGVAKDYTESVKWYRKAAEQGYAFGQSNLGICYNIGQGVAKDYTEAVKWFRKSAEQGNASAQNNLGNSYEKGQGVAQDYAEAAQWYRKSAEQGYVYALYNLGRCYEYGMGVTQNHNDAMNWYSKAADKGHKEAKEKIRISISTATVDDNSIVSSQSSNDPITLNLKVVDKDGAMIGASIYHKRNEEYIRATVTDFDGLASLKGFRMGDVLIISYVKYKTKEISFVKLPTSGNYVVVMKKGHGKEKLTY